MEHTLQTVLVVIALVGLLGGMGILVALGGSGVTGAAVAGIACYEHADCDDSIPATADVCLNPGTEDSLCVNRPRR